MPLRQTIAVGDGANDLPMMAITGLSVAFDAKAPVRDEADIIMDTRDLRQLLPLHRPGRSVPHAEAAVDRDDRAGDVGGVIARRARR